MIKIKLQERHQVEQEFHNAVAGQSRKDFYTFGALELADRFWFHLCVTTRFKEKPSWTEIAKSRLSLSGNLSGKVVLDLGCGRGYGAIQFARMGALVYAIDISAAMVKATERLAKECGLSDKVLARQMSAEKLEFPDEMFDLVAGHSILHHTDLSLTRYEVRRVLKPGGRAVFLEPLGHNPLINLFRRLTPQRRTRTECPLLFRDIEFFLEPFTQSTHYEFYLFALAAFALLPLGSRRLFQTVVISLTYLDQFLMRIFSSLRKFAWVVIIELTA